MPRMRAPPAVMSTIRVQRAATAVRAPVMLVLAREILVVFVEIGREVVSSDAPARLVPRRRTV
jgi:hypothetical protein